MIAKDFGCHVFPTALVRSQDFQKLANGALFRPAGLLPVPPVVIAPFFNSSLRGRISHTDGKYRINDAKWQRCVMEHCVGVDGVQVTEIASNVSDEIVNERHITIPLSLPASTPSDSTLRHPLWSFDQGRVAARQRGLGPVTFIVQNGHLVHLA